MTTETRELEAKKRVVEAGLRLFREGLVARTWGNVSVRLDENRFAVTPSGIPYESLTPDRIVTVSIHDLSHEGRVKPSSEKGLHAAVYRDRPEIGAVIHTHQNGASSFSAAWCNIMEIPKETARIIGPHVLTASYALPGTKRLARSGARALKNTKAALLANHGAVCIGSDLEDAFRVCLALEDLCRVVIETALMKVSGTSSCDPGLIHRLYLERLGLDRMVRGRAS
jgi:L-fuculose-phosphate aldolase